MELLEVVCAMLNDDMAEGLPCERRATTCRGDGSERRPTDATVDLQKRDNCACGCDFTNVCACSNIDKADRRRSERSC